MKAPKYFVETMQDCINVGLNPFAFTLMAESFADKAEKFGGENVVFLSRAHSGQAVWFVMSKQQPTAADFTDTADLLAACRAVIAAHESGMTAGDAHEAIAMCMAAVKQVEGI